MRDTVRWLPALALAACFSLAGWRFAAPRTSSAAVEALAYLSRLDAVAWHEVEGNSVFIGFDSPPPEEWRLICHAAALWGDKATGRTFHAVAIAGHAKGWRPTEAAPPLGQQTASNLMIVE